MLLMPFACMPSMIACGMRVTACLKTFLPFIVGKCLRSAIASAVMRGWCAARRILRPQDLRLAAIRVDVRRQDHVLRRRSRDRRPTAPAPSPNSTVTSRPAVEMSRPVE